jgi:NAD(P)-dependent dehydrogenase (short-subunit alcohol dehydrogenase family)
MEWYFIYWKKEMLEYGVKTHRKILPSEKWFEKIPLGRFGKTEDIADAALFLASDMSRYVTGQVLSVCGGMNM